MGFRPTNPSSIPPRIPPNDQHAAVLQKSRRLESASIVHREYGGECARRSKTPVCSTLVTKTLPLCGKDGCIVGYVRQGVNIPVRIVHFNRDMPYLGMIRTRPSGSNIPLSAPTDGHASRWRLRSRFQDRIFPPYDNTRGPVNADGSSTLVGGSA